MYTKLHWVERERERTKSLGIQKTKQVAVFLYKDVQI
jgi:hypothetical protein